MVIDTMLASWHYMVDGWNCIGWELEGGEGLKAWQWKRFLLNDELGGSFVRRLRKSWFEWKKWGDGEIKGMDEEDKIKVLLVKDNVLMLSVGEWALSQRDLNKGDGGLIYGVGWHEIVWVGRDKCDGEKESKFSDKFDCDELDKFLWVEFDKWVGFGLDK